MDRAIFVSDVHLTDRLGGDAISPDEWDKFIRTEIEPRTTEGRLDLVLLGDIIDVLRSEVWSQEEAKPWSNLGPGFKTFYRLPQAVVIQGILERIELRYSKGNSRLRKLVEANKVRPIFIPGNHDYTLNLSPGLRKRVAEMFGVRPPAVPFRESYSNVRLSVLARHGHQTDWLNHYDREQGRWAIGDAIVIGLVNGVSHFFRARTGRDLADPVVQMLEQLDNVEPVYLVPAFFMFLVEKHIPHTQRHDARLAWQRAVSELSGMLQADPNIWSSELAVKVSGLLPILHNLNTATGAFKTARQIAKYISTHDLQAAVSMSAIDARFLVQGHTHHAGVTPIRGSDLVQPALYLNTGTWRRVVREFDGVTGERGFASFRVASFLVIEKAEGAAPSFEHICRCFG